MPRSAADLLETQALEVDFKMAVDYVSNSETAGKRLSEAQQRSLYGIIQEQQQSDMATGISCPPACVHCARWHALPG